MSTTIYDRGGAGSAEGPQPGAEEMWRLTGCILASRTFRRCPRLQNFMKFVVRCELEGRASEVNEYSIGVQVFGKPADYNPNQDNIVRSTARQLRAKLAEYYASEGTADTWILEIPKGSYLPLWCPASHEVEKPELPRAVLPHWAKMTIAALALTTLFSIATAVWMWAHMLRPSAPARASLLTGLLVNPQTPAMVVVDDPLLPLASNFTSKPVGLKEYLENRYLNDPAFEASRAGFLKNTFEKSQFTTVSSAQLLVRLERLAAQGDRQIQVRHARSLAVEDLARGNLIVVGGAGANPWVDLLQEKLNFQQFVASDHRTRGFRNRSPMRNEPAGFGISEVGDAGKVSYGRLAILHNPLGSGVVAMIGGTSRLATEAVGEFAVTQSGLEQVQHLCHTTEFAGTKGLEVILESSSLAGTPLAARVMAYRCSIPLKP